MECSQDKFLVFVNLTFAQKKNSTQYLNQLPGTTASGEIVNIRAHISYSQ